ncbi:hypothetical protein MTO96_006679 [Rhipicephalus appendiculatus]
MNTGGTGTSLGPGKPGVVPPTASSDDQQKRQRDGAVNPRPWCLVHEHRRHWGRRLAQGSLELCHPLPPAMTSRSGSETAPSTRGQVALYMNTGGTGTSLGPGKPGVVPPTASSDDQQKRQRDGAVNPRPGALYMNTGGTGTSLGPGKPGVVPPTASSDDQQKRQRDGAVNPRRGALCTNTGGPWTSLRSRSACTLCSHADLLRQLAGDPLLLLVSTAFQSMAAPHLMLSITPRGASACGSEQRARLRRSSQRSYLLQRWWGCTHWSRWFWHGSCGEASRRVRRGLGVLVLASNSTIT